MPDNSPTPWRIEELEGDRFIVDANGNIVANRLIEAAVSPVDLDHIVRCVNLHEELVAALEKLVAENKSYDKEEHSVTKNDLKRRYAEYDALLAKAKGE